MNLTKIFVNPNRWVKNSNAQTKEGVEISMTRPFGGNEKEPYFFSLYGCVSYFTEQESQSRSQVMDKLRRAIEKHTGKTMFVAQFNDSEDTSFEDLTEVIKIYNKIQN